MWGFVAHMLDLILKTKKNYPWFVLKYFSFSSTYKILGLAFMYWSFFNWFLYRVRVLSQLFLFSTWSLSSPVPFIENPILSPVHCWCFYWRSVVWGMVDGILASPFCSVVRALIFMPKLKNRVKRWPTKSWGDTCNIFTWQMICT